MSMKFAAYSVTPEQLSSVRQVQSSSPVMNQGELLTGVREVNLQFYWDVVPFVFGFPLDDIPVWSPVLGGDHAHSEPGYLLMCYEPELVKQVCREWTEIPNESLESRWDPAAIEASGFPTALHGMTPVEQQDLFEALMELLDDLKELFCTAAGEDRAVFAVIS
jgi:hypothetical protein